MTEKSIEELCKPLSATVMPAAAKYSISGKVMDETNMRQSQRQSALAPRKRKKPRKD